MNINDEIRAQLQIIGNRIETLDIQNTFVFIDLANDDIEKQLDVSYDVSEPYVINEEREMLAANLRLYINLNIADTTEEEWQASIKLTLEGCFILENSMDEDLLKEMLPVNGCAALYSIARGILSSVTSHMCVNGTILIPMINTFELIDQIENEEK